MCLARFMENLSKADSTCNFWIQFVWRDALAYVGLYLAIRGGNWDLRMASLKLMAPVFSAFDHFTYKKLIAQHIADVHSFPSAVTAFFKQGGFVVSVTGRPWSSVGIDEAHEMQINRACKTSIVHPTKDYINRVAAYLPYRTKCIENLKKQLFADETGPHTQLPLTFESRNTDDRKSIANVKANMSLIHTSGILSVTQTNRGLFSFSQRKASHEQEHDLLSFFEIGSGEFEIYILYYILREASVSAPQRKKKTSNICRKKNLQKQSQPTGKGPQTCTQMFT